MMLDYLRFKNSGKRRRMLNHLVADFAEIAQYSADLTRKADQTSLYNEMGIVLDWLRRSKKRMTEFGVGEGVSRLQDVGEKGDRVSVVGLEKDMEQLIGKVILNEEAALVSSCIKGMLGVGKTTLARQVYNHPAIVGKFKQRAWVTISSDTSVHEVLVELIQQLVVLDGDSLLVEKMDNRSLRQMLRQHLQGMSCFIVVDNLLAEMRLESFLLGLAQIGNGSRLLLTSRYKIERINIGYIHEMKALNPDKSWQLFLKTIDKFTGVENKFSKELERKGREMLKKCWGLPVAIINVGRHKVKQRLSGIEWEQLFDSIDLRESLKILEPMYRNLDETLKACFLLMSLFKENAIMREEKLDHVWNIRGINVGRSCTYRLVSESIFEVVHEFPFVREVKRCHMNPLLHMLSVKKAEEELGFEILRSGNSRLSRSSRIPCHRVIHCGRDKLIHSKNQDKHLVSLVFHGGGRYLDDAGEAYWKSFELLDILDMEDFGVKTLSETIGTLISLRYLGLRNNYTQEIPHSLGGLKRLEVLDIALNFMVEVPDIIKEMGSLRHLYMSDVICREPLKVDALQKLETLTCIPIYDWTYEFSSLEKMSRLRKLGIEEIDENSDVIKLFGSLFKLNRLEHLTLRGFRFRSMPCLDQIGVLDRLATLKLDGRLAKLPSAGDFPQRIRYLILVNTCLGEDPMPELENLPSLERLKLRNAYTGREMVIQHNGFPKLKVLRINELWNLRKIQVGEGAMWKLEQLEIKNCTHLVKFKIGSMKRLRKLRMVTTKHMAAKIRNSSSISRIIEVDISP
ncbi:probable disease resistance protein At1g58602 isoform X2 [Salvia hispanica]|nr:probable disease resistance protein At1g58602 isoform X2 [Salvia hispanica]XP_047950520.1 probable disease resistance protein At1g58602 isoform X2 [Salvia hispanica]